MADTKCKTCRRTGQKLFLKGEKCFSPKCNIIRKPYPPGVKSKRPKRISEYGLQLKEKQKLKFSYGVKEKQFVNYVKKAMKAGGSNIAATLVELLESRLDNVVFKMGLARSRSSARQMVNHGHILVNDKKVSIPSFRVKKGDKISIRTQSVSRKLFIDIDTFFKKFEAPEWMKLNKTKKEAEILKTPFEDSVQKDININLIIEFYSR